MDNASKKLRMKKSTGGKVKSAPIELRVLLTYDAEEKGYIAEIPDLSGCITGGRTRTEALRMAYDAVACCLNGADDKNRKPLPKGVTEEWVHLNWVTAADRALRLSYLKPAPKLKNRKPRNPK